MITEPLNNRDLIIAKTHDLLKAATGYEYEEIKTIVEEDKNGKKRLRCNAFD
ncbi:hypothetical protein [Paenibacillus periandrae]|uniref:hypothetical protein n=1 Tax=Paenibacillus periandrae TaxID=1761741 RepID=UPI001F0890F0|nr:hypothetical protein [Paenibacillus periandrae]